MELLAVIKASEAFPDGSHILIWEWDTAWVWDATSGERWLRLSHFSRVNEQVYGAAWNESGSLVLTWGEDGTARVWDTTNGEERLRLSHGGPVNGAAWIENGSLVLTWSDDGTARVLSLIHI